MKKPRHRAEMLCCKWDCSIRHSQNKNPWLMCPWTPNHSQGSSLSVPSWMFKRSIYLSANCQPCWFHFPCFSWVQNYLWHGWFWETLSWRFTSLYGLCKSWLKGYRCPLQILHPWIRGVMVMFPVLKMTPWPLRSYQPTPSLSTVLTYFSPWRNC